MSFLELRPCLARTQHVCCITVHVQSPCGDESFAMHHQSALSTFYDGYHHRRLVVRYSRRALIASTRQLIILPRRSPSSSMSAIVRIESPRALVRRLDAERLAFAADLQLLARFQYLLLGLAGVEFLIYATASTRCWPSNIWANVSSWQCIARHMVSPFSTLPLPCSSNALSNVSRSAPLMCDYCVTTHHATLLFLA